MFGEDNLAHWYQHFDSRGNVIQIPVQRHASQRRAVNPSTLQWYLYIGAGCAADNIGSPDCEDQHCEIMRLRIGCQFYKTGQGTVVEWLIDIMCWLKSFQMAKERFEAMDIDPYKLKFYYRRERDGLAYSLPSCSEDAGLYPCK
ncbi:unnamed protein product [Dovyalis caffra]|uniref:Uncharacterized protein n=1 Tax=Dovyalis caffra TaxID=77055 RepID=A0AAV1RPY4_9ROSI|nr:unnamed protein product [Dovyalis caffra]